MTPASDSFARSIVAVLVVGVVALAAVMADEAWIRIVAVVTIALLALAWMLLYEIGVRGARESLMLLNLEADRLYEIATAMAPLVTVGNEATAGWTITTEYGQALTDLMGEALASLAEHDHALAEDLADRMRDAWSLYSEHHPRG